MSFLSLVLVYLFWQSAEIEINFVFQVKLNYLNSIVWGSQTPKCNVFFALPLPPEQKARSSPLS